MPAQHRGAMSGIATTTKGSGLLFGPLVAGIAIDQFSPYTRMLGARHVPGTCLAPA